MATYYVNKNAQSSGDHEVHVSTCSHLPDADNRKYLGTYDNCQDAVTEAKKTDSSADGCYYCCKPCNNG